LDFFDYLVYRQSDSLSHFNYFTFLEIFDEGYLIEESPYEDEKEFQAVKNDDDLIDNNIASRDSLRQSSEMESPNNRAKK
jgi:hypothetical protein